jgi:hypothetical protein
MAISEPTSNHEEIRRWAEANQFSPAEQLPVRVDGEPAELRLLSEPQINARQDKRLISWEEFFAKFDEQGLAFVYDQDSAGYNEILQIEQRSPYRHPEQKPDQFQN